MITKFNVKSQRMVLIPEVDNFSAVITSTKDTSDSIKSNTNPPYYVNLAPASYFGHSDSVFNFPFLFDCDGSPWVDANLFLYSLCAESYINRNTKEIKKKANHLLDYKLWLEENNRQLLDLDGRPPQRVTYSYFFHLKNSNICAGNINSRTKTIFDFYKFLSIQPNQNIDMSRVDQTKKINISFKSNAGRSFTNSVIKRSQTVKEMHKNGPTNGFVNDGGESLRPLSRNELDAVVAIIEKRDFSIEERLIIYLGLDTGARKQTIFTLRLKHIEELSTKTIMSDGCYELSIGPGTGIDTKFDKKQKLYIPRYLAEALKLYVNSNVAKNRRLKYKQDERNTFDGKDIYIFLSERGEPYYISKDDPRHAKDRNLAIGIKANRIVEKILAKDTKNEISSQFKFHWTRATFAFLYYQSLVPLIKNNLIPLGHEISLVQKRLGHDQRETTENYLKLFSNINEQRYAQDLYEDAIFKSVMQPKELK